MFEKRRHVDAVAGFQQTDTAAVAGIHLLDPRGAHGRLGQLADTEVLGLELALLHGLAEVLHGPAPDRKVRTCVSVHDT